MQARGKPFSVISLPHAHARLRCGPHPVAGLDIIGRVEFRQKCQAVAEWYDGQEAYPGIACSGELTISENVADLSAAKCIVAAAKKLDHPDLDKLFRAVANTWASTTSRQMREYLATMDVHAPDKLRCNRVLQTIAEFYETYDIQPGDGMWTDPQSRVTVW